MPVSIVSDTTHYLPVTVAEAAGVTVVSLYVNRDGCSVRESEMPGWDGFYADLRRPGDLPTTSQPSVGDFMSAYEPLLAAGHDVLSIHLSAGLSGTCLSAEQAGAQLAERYTNRVTVMDSETACGGLGFVVLAAAAAARNGAAITEVHTQARQAREQMRIWFCIDTLEFLQRGGRVGRAQAWIGGALRIKPILSLESEITPVERVRTSGRAFERMVEYAQSRHDDGADGWAVQHIQAPQQAERLAGRCREIFDCEPLFIGEVGAVIGAHTGPGLLGVGAMPRAFIEA